jgi:hypothetical protein
VKPRPQTPPAGSVVTVRAKTYDALMTATAKTVAALKIENHSEPVLVVYGEDNAASVFCEQAATPPKPGMHR